MRKMFIKLPVIDGVRELPGPQAAIQDSGAQLRVTMAALTVVAREPEAAGFLVFYH